MHVPFPRNLSHREFQNLLYYLGKNLPAYFVYQSDIMHGVGLDEDGGRLEKETPLRARGTLTAPLVTGTVKEIFQTDFRAKVKKNVGANISGLEIKTGDLSEQDSIIVNFANSARDHIERYFAQHPK